MADEISDDKYRKYKIMLSSGIREKNQYWNVKLVNLP